MFAQEGEPFAGRGDPDGFADPHVIADPDDRGKFSGVADSADPADSADAAHLVDAAHLADPVAARAAGDRAADETDPAPAPAPARSRFRRRRGPKPKVVKTGYRRVIDYPRTGRRGWRALIPSRRLVLGGFLGVFIALVGLIAVVYAMVKMPDINDLKMPTATVYEYSDGTVFYTAGLQNRVEVPINQVPPMMQHAIVSVENPTFYTDSGISPRGIARAFVNDVKGGPLQGGSTITQQFIKNAYLTDDQTFTRKITEIFIAVKVTRAYPKQQILDDYLNTVYFGRGCYGVDAAAQTYFGVPVSQITDPSRAAYLAALVNEPTVLSQTTPAAQNLLKQRWNLVLDDMVKTGDITSAQRAAAVWPTALSPQSGIVRDANGVDDSALEQVANVYLDTLHGKDPAVPDAATADAGGDVIVTTFNRAAVTAAVKAVNSGLMSKLNPGESRQAAPDKGVQVGLATVDARSGELLAIYPGTSDFDNATQAQIEPGSQMQAFTTVADGLAGLPSGLGDDRTGDQTLGNAAAQEKANEVLQQKSATALWSLMSKVGLTQNLVADPAELPEPLARLKNDPQLALGVAPESPARMADAFTIFPTLGQYHDLAMALSVTVEGQRVWSYTPPQAAQAVPPGVALFGLKTMSALSLASAASNAAQLGGSSVLPGGSTVALPGGGSVPGQGGAAAGEIDGGGIAGTIGGDVSAWFTGFSGQIVTSVGIWDQSVNSKHQVVQQSLNNLGDVPAASSAQWPAAVWMDFMTAVTTGAHPPLPPGSTAGPYLKVLQPEGVPSVSKPAG